MSSVEAPDESCAVFGSLDGLDASAVNRFVVGEDTAPRVMSREEAAQELGDPFATLVLLKGVFPRTAQEALDKLKEAVPADDPLAVQRPFLLGEGSQFGDEIPVALRNLRFVVATGSGPEGPDIIISTFDPVDGFVELMAWDRASGGFNYYRTVGNDSAWVFAGNSRHALSDPTQGKGPFESHTSGAFIMKELEIPWVHWHSFEATTPASVFEDGDPRREHPWFTQVQGADICELDVALPALDRWAKVRFDRIIEGGGQVSDPGRVLTQITDTHTVNLISSRSDSSSPGAEDGTVRLPAGFFLDVQALGLPSIGLAPPADFTVAAETYTASLQTFEFVLRHRDGFERPGDARFAFLVPGRAQEDVVALREAMRIGLITPRLAACLLMVDFPNPVFSARRQALEAHVPAQASIANGTSSFSEEMAQAILAAAESSPEGSPEREFKQRWEVAEPFVEPFNALLAAYATAVREQLKRQEGFDDYTRLASSRRERSRSMPILRETGLVMPFTNVPDGERAMQADGTVVELEP